MGIQQLTGRPGCAGGGRRPSATADLGGENGGDRLGDRVQVDLQWEPSFQVRVRVKGSKWLAEAGL